MNDEMKFYLLAELSGWNCHTSVKDEKKRIQESESYRLLKENVHKARRHLSGKAREIVRGYETLKIDPKTVYQAFLVENTIDYLCLHSFPEYYLNPFAVDPDYNGEISSLGELIFECAGEEKPLNEIILDDNVSSRIKKEAVAYRLDAYLSDMENIVKHSIEQAKKEAFHPKRDTISAVLRFCEGAFFVLANVFLAFIFIRPFDIFFSFLYRPDPTRLMTYVLYLYPAFVFLYDVVFVLFQSYRARLRESFEYARRFLSKNADSVYESIRDTKERLYDYICGAINNRIELAGDIKDFSRLKDSYIDLRAVLLYGNLKKRRSYRFLRGLLIALTTITLFLFVFSFLVYLLGSLFEVAI